MSWCVVLRPPRPLRPAQSPLSSLQALLVTHLQCSCLSLSLCLSLVRLSLSSSSLCLFLPFICHCFSSSYPSTPTPTCGLPSLPHRHPRCPSGPAASWCLQWHPPGERQSGRRGGAGGGAGRPAGGEAGVGAATRRGRLEKRRGCPQRAGQRWQGGERPLADGAEPPGRREAQLVQVSDGPTAAGAVSSGLPPPVWTEGPLACPLLPPEVPSSAPGSSHPFMRLPSSLPAVHCASPPPAAAPSLSFFASDQVIPFSAPRAASFQSLGHPILFDWPPHLSLQGQQAVVISHRTIHPWGADPLSACSLLQPAEGSRPRR